jgi:hypothetical protein
MQIHETAGAAGGAPFDPAAAPDEAGALVRRRLMEFFAVLAGETNARAAADILLNPTMDLSSLAHSIARTPQMAALYKLNRTSNIQHSATKQPHPDFVGLGGYDINAAFQQNFAAFFAPRLGQRADGFAAIFRAMETQAKPIIVETGCLRVPGNWRGDGQSTFMFDAFVRERGGWAFSIDLTLEAVETAREACSGSTHLILGDSVAALNALAETSKGPISLLYLDSFDLGSTPLPSAIHHGLELIAARPLLGPGSLVVVDDYGIGGQGGKGMIVDQFFSRSSAEVLYSGYQKVWRIR